MAAVRSRVVRDLKEVLDLKESVTLRVIDPTNIHHLQGVILSPECAPTANYIFLLDVKIPSEYPFKPPKITAMNKMWHPKIRPWREGGICLAETSPEGWNPKMKLTTLLLSIGMMLGNPGDLKQSLSSFFNKRAFEDYVYNREAYNKKALEWAEEDNEGYGVVQFEDHRLSAIQTVLAVFPGIIPSECHIIPYECHTFCCRMSKHCFRLTLVVIPSLCIYREKITTSGSIKITDAKFQFKSNAMSLTTSEDSRDKCWTIKTSSSTFEKKKVDLFYPGKDPAAAPQCSVTVEWIRPERPPHRLIHKFCINDCKDDTEITSFDVCIDPERIPLTSRTESGKPTLPLLLHLPVAPDRHINIAEEVGDDSFDFGVHLLNDDNGQITENVHSDEKGSTKNVNRKILMKWLDGQGKPVTWESLVSVLRSIQLNALATDIENAACI